MPIITKIKIFAQIILYTAHPGVFGRINGTATTSFHFFFYVGPLLFLCSPEL